LTLSGFSPSYRLTGFIHKQRRFAKTTLTPIVIAYAGTIGRDQLLLALVLGINMQHQYLLPVSNMPNAVVLVTPHITPNELMKTGAVMSLLGANFFSLVV